MRTFISNSCEKLKIEGFLQFKWEKHTESKFEGKVFKNIFATPSVCENIKRNNGYYIASYNKNIILGFLSNIGKCEHPLIDLAYACAWYNSNLGGIYLIGIDNIKNEYFAPLKKSN